MSDDIAAKVAAGTHFVQDFVPGRVEHASHVLMHHAKPHLWHSREYDMGAVPVVKGAAHAPQVHRWIADNPGRDVLLRMLQAIGFEDGTCCIDYRMVAGRPVLFEINPRFGGSLASRVSPYLDAYLACLASDARQVGPQP